MSKIQNLPPALVAAWLAGATAPALAIGCDELRAGIDARIRASGVNNFSLMVVAADAAAPGSVVGRCELGAKKIHYLKGAAAAQATAAPSAARPSTAPATPPKAAPVITECDDGRSVTRGQCKP